jgi:hypothetical protein
MNQFFLESRGKEKVKELLNEGQRSQAFHRSGTPSIGLRGASKLVAGLLGLIGLLSLLIR